MKKIYLDYASTSPCDPEVVKAMEPYFFERFGNASSPHAIGREANKALEDARQTVADFLGAQPEEIIFTSGATESNNHAIRGVAYRLKNKGNHILTTKIEHHSVLEPVESLRKEGFQVSYLNVDAFGQINVEDVEKSLTDQTILVCVIHASNEIGTIQPIAAIGRLCREKGSALLIDAVQTVGHIPVQMKELNGDLLSLSAHKFYGPKGVGALYVRQGTALSPLILGGDQERGRRASTQNVAGAVGLGKAMELCLKLSDEEALKQSALRDRLLKEIPQKIPGVRINGHLQDRLPNNAHFSFERVQGEALLMSLDMVGIAASMGSACTSGAMEPSHVLKAVGLSDELAFGSLRITIGRWTTSEEIDYFLEQLPKIITRLRI